MDSQKVQSAYQFKVGDIVKIAAPMDDGFNPIFSNPKTKEYPYFKIERISGDVKTNNYLVNVTALPYALGKTNQELYLTFSVFFCHRTDINDLGQSCNLRPTDRVVCVNSYSRRELLNLGFVYVIDKTAWINGEWRIFLEGKKDVHFSLQRFEKMPALPGFMPFDERVLVVGEDVYDPLRRQMKTVTSVDGSLKFVGTNFDVERCRGEFISVVDLLTWLGKHKEANNLADYYDGLSKPVKKLPSVANFTHVFEVGDYVECVKDESNTSLVHDTGVGTYFYHADQFKKYDPKFSVGDEVVCIERNNVSVSKTLTLGKTYRVISISGDNSSWEYVTVENDIGRLSPYMNYRFKKSEKKPVGQYTSNKAESKFKVGDVVTPIVSVGSRLLFGINYVVIKICDSGSMVFIEDSSGVEAGWYETRFKKATPLPNVQPFVVGDLVRCIKDYPNLRHEGLELGGVYMVKEIRNDYAKPEIKIEPKKDGHYWYYESENFEKVNVVNVVKEETKPSKKWYPEHFGEWFTFKTGVATYYATVIRIDLSGGDFFNEHMTIASIDSGFPQINRWSITKQIDSKLSDAENIKAIIDLQLKGYAEKIEPVRKGFLNELKVLLK